MLFSSFHFSLKSFYRTKEKLKRALSIKMFPSFILIQLFRDDELVAARGCDFLFRNLHLSERKRNFALLCVIYIEEIYLN